MTSTPQLYVHLSPQLPSRTEELAQWVGSDEVCAIQQALLVAGFDHGSTLT
jgi:hypothetical protein